MKIIDILTSDEIEAANSRGLKIIESPLKALTVNDLKTLFPCLTFKIQNPEADGHAAAHVLNELHLRIVSMDFYPEANTIDEAVALRKKGNFKPRLI